MYDELFEAWRREGENINLQALPKDFYTRLADYVRRVREEIRMIDEESLRGKLLQREEENIKKMICDLIRVRYDKILRLISSGETMPITALTDEEENLYNNLSLCAEAYKNLLDDILHGRKPRKMDRKGMKGFLVVRVIKEIPQI
ncbi:MAG: hypothetical protein QW782_02295, partial [Candidatus Bathyarchaeia archaeon]